MSRRYKFGNHDKLYFISYGVVFWIELFTRNEYRDILVNSWKYCQLNKGLEIYSWIIMPSHVQLIISTHQEPLDDIVRDMKRFSSTQLRKAISNNSRESRKGWLLMMMQKAGFGNSNNHDWQLWQQQNNPLEIQSVEMFYRTIEYIHYNPVAAGFVTRSEDWLYSSAGDFFGCRGMIELAYLL